METIETIEVLPGQILKETVIDQKHPENSPFIHFSRITGVEKCACATVVLGFGAIHRGDTPFAISFSSEGPTTDMRGALLKKVTGVYPV